MLSTYTSVARSRWIWPPLVYVHGAEGSALQRGQGRESASSVFDGYECRPTLGVRRSVWTAIRPCVRFGCFRFRLVIVPLFACFTTAIVWGRLTGPNREYRARTVSMGCIPRHL